MWNIVLKWLGLAGLPVALVVTYWTRTPSVTLSGEGPEPPHRVRSGVPETKPYEFSPFLVESHASFSAFPRDRSVPATAFLTEPFHSGVLGQSLVRNSGLRIDEPPNLNQKRERRATRLIRRPLLRERMAPESDNRARGQVVEKRERQRAIDRCAGKGVTIRGSATAPSGKLALRWIIRTDGSPNNLEIREDTLRDLKLSRCILNAVRMWRFSPPARGEESAQSTFIFL